ncbi:MAG: hypothetical protein K5656_05960 [Lachnospiraceae bacterium]|nr:hypothetical protein [Lachnospiraceae bacterium]
MLENFMEYVFDNGFVGIIVLVVVVCVVILIFMLEGYLWNYFMIKEFKKMNKNLQSLDNSVLALKNSMPIMTARPVSGGFGSNSTAAPGSDQIGQ